MECPENKSEVAEKDVNIVTIYVIQMIRNRYESIRYLYRLGIVLSRGQQYLSRS